jgi:YHS domain-containing protein
MLIRKIIPLALLALVAFTNNLMASGSHSHGGSHGQEGTKHAATTKGTQKVCPIQKKAIDPEVFIEYQGQKVYFCCPGCDNKFLEDTEIYFGQMKERGEVAENVQTLCPVSGDKLDEDKVSLTLPGRKINFCCKKCVRQFKKDKAKYIKNLNNKVESKEGNEHKGHDHSGHHH